jgi:transcriptional regulator with XRE-family HTH domain
MIGVTIREIREKNNMRQEDLSTLLNIKQCTLSNYESEKRIPDIYTLIKIADIFNISLDYLCGRYNKAS